MKKTRIKEFIFIFLLFVFSLLLFRTDSKAMALPVAGYDNRYTTYQVGTYPNYQGYPIVLGQPGSKAFCIEQGQNMQHGTLYRVLNYIRIDGNTAQFFDGNTTDPRARLAVHENDENQVMAWIFNQNDSGTEYPAHGQYGEMQRAIYGYIKVWGDANDYTAGGTNSGGYTIDWIQNGIKLIQDYKNAATLINNTNTANVTKETISHNGQNYIKVGPFNITYNGQTFTKFNVLNQDNNAISGVLLGKYNGNTLNVYDMNHISSAVVSGQNFYVLIPASSGTTKINNIEIEIAGGRQTFNANLWVLVPYNGAQTGYQNLIVGEGDYDMGFTYANLSLGEVELFGELLINKTDADTGEKLPDIGFRLRMTSGAYAGQYVSIDNSGNAIYSSTPTDMMTNLQGQIHINQLAIGTYELTETINPILGYENKEVVITKGLTIVSGTTVTQNVTNKKQYGNLVITKKDKDTGETLADIGFTIQMVSGDKAGQYVSIDSNGNAVYSSSPVTVYTNVQGQILINNLYQGTYEVIETENPYEFYADTPIVITSDLSITAGETLNYDIENDKVYAGLLIEKTDEDTGETLANIGFTIQMLDGEKAGQYISVDGSGNAVYNTIQTTIYTNDMGQIEINKLYPGTYEVIETENPYDFYADTPIVITSNLVLNAGAKLNYDIENEKIYGYLEIEKTDKDTGEILSDIGFTIQMLNGEKAGQYVSINDEGKAEYNDTPTTIYTDEDGRIEIKNLYPGTYEAVETENPYDFYENTPFVIASDIEITVGEELTYDMENEKIYGNLVIEKRDEDTGETMPDIGFTIQMLDGEKAGQYVSINEKGKAVYSQTPTTIYTDEAGRIEIKSLYPGRYEIVETENPVYGYERVPLVITSDVRISIGEITNADLTNKMVYGKLKITKTDQDTGEPMSDIGFTLQMIEGEGNKEGQYVSIDENGEAVYSETPATIYTDENGEISIDYIYIGTYELIETENPYFGYEDVPKLITSDLVVTPGENVTNLSATNRREYIKIRGYAWEDRAESKESIKDYEWHEGTYDERLANVTVRLKNANGQVLAETVTDSNGEYVFGNYDEDPNAVKVRIDDLVGAYIEFEYNGMSYKSIDVNINFTTSSASDGKGNVVSGYTNTATDEGSRDEFNNNYATIDGTGAYNTSGQHTYNISYSRGNHSSSVIYGDNVLYGYDGQLYPIAGVYDQYIIQAVTQASENNVLCTSYTPDQIRQSSIIEIGGLNLGVEEREMPDLAITQDMEEVQISLNGYTHTYEYSQRYNDPEDYAGGDGFNVSVKFENKYLSNSYSREVYSSDLIYNGQPGNEGSLQIFVTYRVKIRNESTNLYNNVRSLVNYYDARYENVVVRDANGNILNTTNDNYNADGYRKLTINLNEQIRYQDTSEITITYQLNNDAVNSILNEDVTLSSVTEVNSYSTYSDEGYSQVYAGIDLDSAPDNSAPTNTDTFEDDTDRAPSLILQVIEGRNIQGKVWEDSAIQDLLEQTGYNKERKGDGIYGADENVVNNVTVDLMTVDDAGNLSLAQLYQEEGVINASTTTNQSGDYTLDGVIPSIYVLRYTYGNNSVIVDTNGNVVENVDPDNYKSTIYRAGDKTAAEAMDDYWYRDETSNTGATRLSDAKDNDDIISNRIDPSSPNQEINYENVTNGILSEISADTRRFEILMDYDVNHDRISEYGEDLKFIFDNIDFGIIKRPQQDLEVDKEIGYIQIMLANGTNIIEGDPRTQNISGLRRLDNGDVYIEIDNEIIQGATLRITYEISVDNSNCEVDYNDEDYYIYGTVPEGNANWSTTSVVDMFDYLPEELILQNSDTTNWETISLTPDMRGTILAEEVYDTVSELQNVIHLKSAVFQNMEPGTRAVDSTLIVSRQLSTTADDLAYENDIEVVRLTGGKPPTTSTPGNYDPTTNQSYDPGTDTYGGDEPDDDEVEIVITPPTGTTDIPYMTYGIIGITVLVVIGVGIIIIKKKVLK